MVTIVVTRVYSTAPSGPTEQMSPRWRNEPTKFSTLGPLEWVRLHKNDAVHVETILPLYSLPCMLSLMFKKVFRVSKPHSVNSWGFIRNKLSSRKETLVSIDFLDNLPIMSAIITLWEQPLIKDITLTLRYECLWQFQTPLKTIYCSMWQFDLLKTTAVLRDASENGDAICMLLTPLKTELHTSEGEYGVQKCHRIGSKRWKLTFPKFKVKTEENRLETGTKTRAGRAHGQEELWSTSWTKCVRVRRGVSRAAEEDNNGEIVYENIKFWKECVIEWFSPMLKGRCRSIMSALCDGPKRRGKKK